MSKKIDIGFFVRMFAPMVLTGLKEAVKNLENDIAKASLVFAIEEVEAAVNLLTDGDKENAKQFAEYYKDNWREKADKLLNIIDLMMPDNKETAQLKKMINR